MPRNIRAADLFCGAGGTSSGLSNACRQLGLGLDLLAVNHWDVAIETHSKNHPKAKHLCASLDAVNPLDHVPSGRLELLVASPECTHFSSARGGRPMSDQSRASAWLILKWLQELYVENVLIENVPEFRTWGPLGADGRPLKSKRGTLFEQFLSNLRSLGYAVDHRILNAADYGDATTRERLFIIARRGRRQITWPEPSHTRDPQPRLFGVMKQRWRPAREIIDWSIPGKSIFTRKKPLAKATLERILAGMQKYRWPDPFIVILRRHMDAQSIDQPLPTVTASGQHVGLCQPFVLGQQSGSVAREVDEPIPTVAGGGAISVVQPFMVSAGGPEGKGRNPHSVDKPLGTVLCEDKTALVQPFVAELRNGKIANAVDDPLSTVTTKGAHHAVVQPFVMPVNHGRSDTRSYEIEKPFPTVTTVDAWSVVSPMVVEYYGTADARSVDDPIATVTAKDRFGLAVADTVAIDILFRMLQPHELAAAMGYESFQFAGTREQKVKQIGNGVPERLARALCTELLKEKAGLTAEACA